MPETLDTLIISAHEIKLRDEETWTADERALILRAEKRVAEDMALQRTRLMREFLKTQEPPPRKPMLTHGQAMMLIRLLDGAGLTRREADMLMACCGWIEEKAPGTRHWVATLMPVSTPIGMGAHFRILPGTASTYLYWGRRKLQYYRTEVLEILLDAARHFCSTIANRMGAGGSITHPCLSGVWDPETHRPDLVEVEIAEAWLRWLFGEE